MVGLTTALLLFLLLGITGVVGSGKSTVPLVFVQFLVLLLAGFAAGRFSAGRRVLAGGRAGLLLFAFTVVISGVISRTGPTLPDLVLLGIIAAVLGSAGGALAEWRFAGRQRAEPPE